LGGRAGVDVGMNMAWMALIIDVLDLMLLADSMIRCYDRGIMV
jgi:hypothetical protein